MAINAWTLHEVTRSLGVQLGEGMGMPEDARSEYSHECDAGSCSTSFHEKGISKGMDARMGHAQCTRARNAARAPGKVREWAHGRGIDTKSAIITHDRDGHMTGDCNVLQM